ncbi:MAG: DUF1559 domain-containing protein [Planctomycetota bacterium]|nr:DUF1559 domain-containing protein [Planctomycetota bacterium]
MQCPACAERIPADTEICPYCETDVQDYKPSRTSKKKKGGTGKSKKSGSGMSLGVILAICAVALFMCGGVLLALLLPAVQQAREAARRTQCKNNLKQIGLALHNYNDTWGSFPPAAVYSADGRPMHSWRVLILPFIDQMPLYNSYKMDEPWDGPNNIRFQAMMPSVFACSSNPAGQAGGYTHYLGITGKGTILPQGKGVKFVDVKDGLSNTLVVVEAMGSSVPWTQPIDIDATNGLSFGPGGMGSYHTGGAHVLMADGMVRFVSQNVNPQTLKSLSTIDGGEVVFDY